MALIECKIRREKGTTVELESDIYKFKPGKDGAHVCEVKNPTHIQRFLMIPEAYKIHGAGDVEPIKEPEPVVDTEMDDDTSDFNFESLDRWSNKKLNAFAESLAMNPKSKESIADIAMDQFDVKLDKRKQPTAMIRQFAEILRDGGLNDNNDE